MALHSVFSLNNLINTTARNPNYFDLFFTDRIRMIILFPNQKHILTGLFFLF